MNSRIASLLLLVACLAAIPAMAQNLHNSAAIPAMAGSVASPCTLPCLYTSGGPNMSGICLTLGGLMQFPGCVPPIGPANPPPANPPLNNITADTFQLGSCTCTIQTLLFYVWLFSGDTLETVQVSIYSNTNPPAPYDYGTPPTLIFTGTVHTQQGDCVANMYGFNLCGESASLSVPLTANRYYYLVLSGATVANGDTVGWDQNGMNYSTAFPADYSLGSPASWHKVGTETFELDGN